MVEAIIPDLNELRMILTEESLKLQGHREFKPSLSSRNLSQLLRRGIIPLVRVVMTPPTSRAVPWV